MVTDFVELYYINIKIQGECPFILVHTPVNYDTKRHRRVVSPDAYNTRTSSEESVSKMSHNTKNLWGIIYRPIKHITKQT